MQKRLEIEGSAAAKMVQLMRGHGYNKDLSIDIATVITPLPALSVRLSDGVMLEREDLVLTYTLSKQTLERGDAVIVIGDDDTQFYFAIDKAVI